MAHFAEIDQNNKVIRVLVVPDDQEHRGQEFLADDLDLGGQWIQTSYNHRIRNIFAGVGMNYDPDADLFYPAAPYSKWILDKTNWTWLPPIPAPSNKHEWNDEIGEWILNEPLP